MPTPTPSPITMALRQLAVAVAVGLLLAACAAEGGSGAQSAQTEGDTPALESPYFSLWDRLRTSVAIITTDQLDYLDEWTYPNGESNHRWSGVIRDLLWLDETASDPTQHGQVVVRFVDGRSESPVDPGERVTGDGPLIVVLVPLHLLPGESDRLFFGASVVFGQDGTLLWPVDLAFVTQEHQAVLAWMGEFEARQLVDLTLRVKDGRAPIELEDLPAATSATSRGGSADDLDDPDEEPLGLVQGPTAGPGDVGLPATIALVLPSGAEEEALAAEQAGESWILKVGHPRVGVVYAAAVAAGSHEASAVVPPGVLEVQLLEEEGHQAQWELGVLASPLVTARRDPPPGTVHMEVVLAWRNNTVQPFETWSDDPPFVVVGATRAN